MNKIEKAAVETHIRLSENGELSPFNMFKAGAEWQNKQDIEKACKWIYGFFDYYPFIEKEVEEADKERILSSFIKFMKK